MKKKLLIISSFCICLSFIGLECGQTIPQTPESNRTDAVKLYTGNSGLTWEEHTLGSYTQATGISFFSYDLSTFSMMVINRNATGNDFPEIIKTTNFGDNWISTISGGKQNLDISNGGINGKGFHIRTENDFSKNLFLTTDDGSSWTTVYSYNRMYAMEFGDENNGIIIPELPGDNTSITTNGGLNWTQGSPITSSAYINAIGFVNSNTAVVCGNGGKIFRTTDLGSSWTEITSPTSNDLQGIDFNIPVGIIVGNGSTILRTTDSGLSWLTGTVSSTANLKKVHLSDLAFWACGDNIIISSYNTGNTWGILRNVSDEYYKDLFFIKNAGFVVGTKD